MRITKLALKNWGPHENLTLDMDTGVFGLFGPNASGKTNILEGIEYGFTGMLQRTQETYVRKDSSGKQAPNGSVEISFRKGGLEGRIFRQLGTSPRRELHWEGTKYTKVGDIDRLLGQILDCDKRAISLAVFLTQGHIGDFLFENGAKREELFAKMCLIDHLSNVADITAQLSRELAGRITDLTSQRDEALMTRDSAAAALKNAELELTLLPDLSLPLAWLEQRQRLGEALFQITEARQRQSGAVTQAQERLNAIAPLAIPAGLQEVTDVASYRDFALGAAARIPQNKVAQGHIVRARQQTAEQRVALERCEARRKELGATVPQLVGLRAQQPALRNQLQQHHAYKTAANAWEKGQKGVQAASDLLITLKRERAEGPPPSDLNAQETEIRAAQVSLAPLRLGLRLAREVEQDGHTLECCPLCRSTRLDELPTGAELLAQEKELAAREQQLAAQLAHVTQQREAMLKLDTRIAAGTSVVQMREQELLGLADPATLTNPGWDDAAERANQQKFEANSITLQQLEAGAEELQRSGAEIKRLQEILAETASDEAYAQQLAQLEAEAAADQVHAAKLKEIVDHIDLLALRQREVQDAAAAVTQLGQQIAVYESEITVLNLRRPKELNIPAGLDEARAAVTVGLAEVGAKQQARVNQQGAVTALISTLRRTESRVAEIEERVRGNAKLQSVIGDLDLLREAFGRTGIPRHYLSQVFDGLVAGTQENLATWEEDFQVEKDPNNLFNFLFYRGNDPETLLDQSQLSGGQRTRLAISFLQAVQQIVLPEVNFMVLDEPSADLDVDGIDGLGRLFEAMGRSLDNEAQVIVVTHHPALRTSMGKSVTLEKIA